jgi:acetate kinase
MTKIISVNAGSSSLKFQLFNMPSEEVVCSGIFERIGLEDGIFQIKVDGKKDVVKQPFPTHSEAVDMLLKVLVDKNIVSSLDEISAVGHRVVHGGEYYNHSVLLTPEVEAKVDELSDLAPLTQPSKLNWLSLLCKSITTCNPCSDFRYSISSNNDKRCVSISNSYGIL